MQSGLGQKLPSIFGTGFFRIPDYQRGYAWKEKQLTELWEDLEDIQKEPNSNSYKPHYTGMLSLKEIPNNRLLQEERALVQKGMAEFYDVVDGQQRLTSILVLLYVLSKKQGNKYLVDIFIRTSKKNPVYKFCYAANNNNNNCLKGEVFEDPQTLPSNSNVYTENLKFAKKFFTDRVNELTSSKQKELVGKILNALLFDIRIIDNSLDVQVVFETMNNRGKKLTILEKLKNRLMYLADKKATTSSLSTYINQSWGIVYEYLGKNQVMLDEDEFLSSHLTLLREPADYSFSVKDAERKVFEMFCSRAEKYNLSDKRDQTKPAKEPSVDENKIRQYATDIAQFVPSWYQINNLDINHTLDKQIQIILCLNSTKEVKIFLAQLASMAKSNPKDVLDCLKLVENILFINSLPISNKIDERRLANKARELHLQITTLQQVISELKQSLMALPITLGTISDGFKGLFTYVYGKKGYHRWSGLKYFLFKYEESIYNDPQKGYSKNYPIIKWNLFDDTSIEHILPQDTANWQIEINAYFNGKSLSTNEIKEAEKILINSLGNLTILRANKNPSLGNKPWSIKQPAYSSGCYMEKEISKYPLWNAKTIYERGKLMLNYMKTLIPILNNMSDPSDYETLLFCEKKYLP